LRSEYGFAGVFLPVILSFEAVFSFKIKKGLVKSSLFSESKKNEKESI